MKKLFIKSCSVFILITAVPFCGFSQLSYFTNTSESSVAKAGQKRVIIPAKYRTVALDTGALLRFLRMLPAEQAVANRSTAPVILLPMPDGSIARFHIWESSTMAPELAARYPTLRTFSGQGITDATATLKLDFTELGFHAQILSPVTSAVYIDPYAQGAMTACISYYKKDFQKKEPFTEGVPIPATGSTNRADAVQSEQCVGSNLRTYRLAMACTGEYAVAATGQASPTKAQALSAIVTTVNRVNGIYEKELSLRVVLVATQDSVVYTNAATDPFNGNNNANTLIIESQTVIDNRISNANYDMGHTLSTGGGGLSGLGIICRSGQKARTITGSPNPVGDAYDVDYVAHEMGHACGGNHTFNSILVNCNGNGNNTTNTEPGSGTTIMAYAGICGADNLQPNSDPQFHAVSLDEISTYTFLSTGNTCGTLTSTGNTPPVVNAGANYIIPKSTPFILTGSATDANGDALTYSWEEIDKGGPYGAWNAPAGNAPLFRSFVPVTTPIRFFPKLSNVISNTITIGEILPSYARTMRFRLTARDNRAGGGGVCFDSTSLVVDGTAAPFAVTAPTATGVVWYVNDFNTVTWNASTTAVSPINCANVTIQLSTDGGLTFPITLLASTPNDGSQEIQVPNNAGTNCRVRVLALGNVFYDMSNNNFTIQVAPSANFAFNQPEPVIACTNPAPIATLLTASLSGFSNLINLSTGIAPAGTTVSYSADPVTPGNSVTITLNGSNTLAPGSYLVSVRGNATGASGDSAVISFVVGATQPPASLTTPAAYATGISITPTFSWASVPGATSYNLEIATTADFTGTLISLGGLSSNSYTPATPLAENTTYFWRIKTVGTCGTSDNSAVSVFRTIQNNCNAAFAQDFVSTTFPPANLTIVNPNNNNTWVRRAAGNGNVGSALIDNYNNSTLRQTDDLQTQPYTPGTTTDSVIFSFDLAHKYYSNTDSDTLCVLVSADNGTTFTTQYSKTGATLATAGLSTNDYTTPAATDWRRERIALGSPFLTAGPLIFAIRNINDFGNNIFIDNISICQPVRTPITFTFTGNGAWSNSANWNSTGKPPAILPANCEIIIDPTTEGQCLLDITQRISTGAKLTVKTGKMIVIPGAVIVQ